jgi:starch synthase
MPYRTGKTLAGATIVTDVRILFAAAEASPIAKVGGMADVVGTLPPVLRQMGLDVRIIIPFYGFLWTELDFGEPVWSADVMFTRCNVYESILPGTDVPLYLVEHYAFAPHRIYYGDDEQWRFTFFANVVAEFCWNYWKPNVIHCHDWHTGMIPAWLRETSDIGTVFTVHNLAYQGPWRWQLERMTWVPWFFNVHNTMAAGIAYADLVTTVSPTYAREICTPIHGEGLQGLLAAIGLKLHGILNGIDRKLFNPATDTNLVRTFDLKTLERREGNKLALQTEVGLLPDSTAFLIGMVSRMVEQKGIDLMLQVMERFLSYSNAQLVVLGSGESGYETRTRELSHVSQFNPQLAPRIYAGADAFLMPSRFEPCGISQIVALRYGCVPIVRRTGGLVDTVSHHVPAKGEGTGYCFDRYEPLDLFTCMVRAWEGFQYKDAWRSLQQRGMAMDFGWDKSAVEYVRLYSQIVGRDLLGSLTQKAIAA